MSDYYIRLRVAKSVSKAVRHEAATLMGLAHGNCTRTALTLSAARLEALAAELRREAGKK